jgi:hypothetical protein
MSSESKAGLAPFDLCTVKYQFDRSWAMKDPECRKRIKRYEKGDKMGLGNPTTQDVRQQGD